jgi:hypothetical protein
MSLFGTVKGDLDCEGTLTSDWAEGSVFRHPRTWVRRNSGAVGNQTISNNTWTTLLYDTTVVDDLDWHDGTESGDFTVTLDGLYLLEGGVFWEALNPGQDFNEAIRITVNGVVVRIRTDKSISQNSIGEAQMITALWSLRSGDVVRFQAWQDSGGDVDSRGTGAAGMTRMAITYIGHDGSTRG